MLECQNCHHDVLCRFRILEKYQRFWLDLDQDVLFSSGVSQSLRVISERWSEQIEGNVGLRTINERINRREPLIRQMQKTVFPTSPTVVQLDGIWVTVQSQGEKVKPDRRKRQRKQRTGKKIVILVALGFWENGTREILDWQIAASEEHTQWEGLLKRLWTREVRPEKGLRMIVRDGCGGLEEAVALVYGKSVLDQRCVFHKLKNVGDKVRSELKGEEKREKRKQMMKQAKTIYQAPNVLQAKQHLQQWSEQWREEAPKAVATLERDFEQTLVYYELDTVPQEWIRTTSLLERTNRELRRKFRQVVTFGSQIGAQVAVYLQVQRLHARWTHASWWQVSHDLIFEMGNINP